MKHVFNTTEWRDLLHLCKKWKADKDRLVFTNGCFDGLHAGHLALLEFARKQGDRLIVGLNSDNSVRELKGKGRPQYGADRRAHDILQSGHADAVVIFEERTPGKIIAYLRPDVLVKGSDYRPETIVGADTVRGNGGRVLIFPRIPGYSSSELLIKGRTGKREQK